ncbi:phosphotransferase enzyme family protein [Algoriphagus formosus]|uniref:Aminoglycoside phosphotransferase family protein n=1 Tax=Algoriphagus formosus TaxID=2007308 RepID=A0A4R5UYG9_9BACT|nr:aminoglycoside phosphotransferase family protein [Algoriphagus aquimaris]TDK44146.1 aminoglycoside phosphotransferase family protein [Algoriphagus aquimaris]
MNLEKLSPVLRQYEFFEDLDACQVKPLGAGLIHETFLIESPNGKYVLQGFNQEVFQYPDRIAFNLEQLYTNQIADNLPFELPLPLLNENGEQLSTVDGKNWRVFPFVKGQTLEQISSKNQARNAASAFAEFSKAGTELKVDILKETIPDFHRLDLRFERFCAVASGMERKLDSEEESILRFYLNQKPLIENYKETTQKLPLRLTHNDTKINNLIFSESLDRVKALIDLDTVMPGYLLYDFGDLVRTVACTRTEISTDWENLRLDESVFEALMEGYLSGLGNLVEKEERESLLLGGEVMTCMMGLRFFTDHLQGNIYYRVNYPEQNLHRAKNQSILLRDLQSKRELLRNLWIKASNHSSL